MDVQRRIFKAGSRTYFNCALFFPKEARNDVFIMYAFLRTADDLVDGTPPDREGFNAFREKYRAALSGKPANDEVIDSFFDLAKRKQFDPRWAEAFFKSMELDLSKSNYKDIRELEQYIYGSAEVIGLMMVKILGLPEAAVGPARALGKAMQYINIIRDINVDLKMGRTYLPREELKSAGLNSLYSGEAVAKKSAFTCFIKLQARRFNAWLKEAEDGYKYLPKRYLVPIKTAADMYRYTAETIEKDPCVVYKRTVKPSRIRVLARAVANYFSTK